MKRGKLTPQQWREVVERYEKSGMEQKAFAKDAGVEVAALQYWLYKVRGERGDKKRRRAKGSPPAKQRTSFVEVKAAPTRATGRVEVDLPSGVRIRFETGMDAAMIGAVTEALSRC